MRLVTFQGNGGPQKAGAFLDDNSRVVDLAAACEAAFGADPTPTVMCGKIVLDEELPAWVPIPALAEMQVAGKTGLSD